MLKFLTWCANQRKKFALKGHHIRACITLLFTEKLARNGPNFLKYHFSPRQNPNAIRMRRELGMNIHLIETQWNEEGGECQDEWGSGRVSGWMRDREWRRGGECKDEWERWREGTQGMWNNAVSTPTHVQKCLFCKRIIAFFNFSISLLLLNVEQWNFRHWNLLALRFMFYEY